MTYYQDPAEFMRHNYAELLRFCAWVLIQHHISFDTDQLVTALGEWYLRRCAGLLRIYDPQKGTLESLLRLSLAQHVPQWLRIKRRAFNQHETAVCLDASSREDARLLNHEVIGCVDEAYGDVEMDEAYEKFLEWAQRGNVKYLGSKLQIVEALKEHEKKDLPKILGCSKQHVWASLHGFKQDFDSFMRRK